MSETISIVIDGQPVTVPKGTTVAVALARSGVRQFRVSVQHQSRAPLCGMGICMECFVTINGIKHCRSCVTLCEPDMEVISGE